MGKKVQKGEIPHDADLVYNALPLSRVGLPPLPPIGPFPYSLASPTPTLCTYAATDSVVNM